MGGGLAFILLTLILWPVAALVRRRYRRVVAPDPRSRALHVAARLFCLCLAGMLAALAFPMSRVNEDVAYLGDKSNPWLSASHIFGWLACGGLAILIVATLRFWRHEGIGTWARVHCTLLTLSVLGFLWFAWSWHLLSPSLKF